MADENKTTEDSNINVNTTANSESTNSGKETTNEATGSSEVTTSEETKSEPKKVTQADGTVEKDGSLGDYNNADAPENGEEEKKETTPYNSDSAKDDAWTDTDQLRKDAEKIKEVQDKLRNNKPLTDDEKKYEERAKAANTREDNIESAKKKLLEAEKKHTEPVLTEAEQAVIEEAKNEIKKDKGDPLAKVNTAESYKNDKRMKGKEYKNTASPSEKLKQDENFLWNRGNDPLVNFNFTLIIEAGLYNLPCKAIKGIRRENEFEYIQEGGLNDYVHMKRKPISKPFTFQVERYVGSDFFDPIGLGTELVLPVLLMCSRYAYKSTPPRIYLFTGCVVTAKDYGDLDAEKSGLMVETTTIAYRQMVCFDIPNAWTWLESQVWSLKDDGRNSDKRHYMKAPTNDTWESSSMYSKENMENSAKFNMYDINPDPPVDPLTGQLKTSGRIHDMLVGSSAASRRSKDEMLDNADPSRYISFRKNTGKTARLDDKGRPTASAHVKKMATAEGDTPTLSKAQMLERLKKVEHADFSSSDKQTASLDNDGLPTRPDFVRGYKRGAVTANSLLTKKQMEDGGSSTVYNINKDGKDAKTAILGEDGLPKVSDQVTKLRSGGVGPKSTMTKAKMVEAGSSTVYNINEGGKEAKAAILGENGLPKVSDQVRKLRPGGVDDNSTMTKAEMVEAGKSTVYNINEGGKEAKAAILGADGLPKVSDQVRKLRPGGVDDNSTMSKAEMVAAGKDRTFNIDPKKQQLEKPNARKDRVSVFSKKLMTELAENNLFAMSEKSKRGKNKTNAKTSSGLKKETMTKNADKHLFVFNKKSKRGSGKMTLSSAHRNTDVPSRFFTKKQMVTEANKNVFLINTNSTFAKGKQNKSSARHTAGLTKGVMVEKANGRMFVFSLKGKRGSKLKDYSSAHVKTDVPSKIATKTQMEQNANRNRFPAKRSARDINKLLKKK